MGLRDRVTKLEDRVLTLEIRSAHTQAKSQDDIAIVLAGLKSLGKAVGFDVVMLTQARIDVVKRPDPCPHCGGAKANA